jgi:hypothetical protein
MEPNNAIDCLEQHSAQAADTLGRASVGDVVSYGLEVGQPYIFEEMDVDVGGNNSAGWTDLITQPGCYGTDASARFQTSRPTASSERGHSPFRHGIRVLLRQTEPASRVFPGIVQRIISRDHPQGMSTYR